MKKSILSVFIVTLVFLNLINAQVSRKDSIINWFTYDYTLNANNTLASYSLNPNDMVEKTFNTIIIENEYLKVTLVPEFGGRVLSMIYKPTGHEELYQNPVGAPYGWWWTGTFIYNWLMIYGGIFPTLTEPEHGKAWFLPWDYNIIKETSDTISVKMSWDDDVSFTQYTRYGTTDIDCDFIVTLVSGSTALEIEVILNNKSNLTQRYEYWTNTGMAPGSNSELYSAAATGGAELIIPAEKLKIPSWAQIKNLEQSVPGEFDTYYFENLKMFKNWDYSGSAFSRPALTKNFWGVINHDNGEGLIRISDNVQTPYVKIWTFGFQSTKIDPFNPPTAMDNAADTYFGRPFIELWAGVSSEFNVPATFLANSTKSWKEYYTPTVGLANVTHARKNAIAQFQQNEDEVLLNYFITNPSENYTVEIAVQGDNNVGFIKSTIRPDATKGNQLSTSLPGGYTWTDNDNLLFTIKGSNDEILLDGTIPLNTGNVTDVNDSAGLPSSFNLDQNYPNPFNPTTVISYQLSANSDVKLNVYDVLGQEVATLVNGQQNAGTYNITFDASNLPSGLYLYRFEAGLFIETRKMILVK